MSFVGLVIGSDVEQLGAEALRKVLNTLVVAEATAAGCPLGNVDISARDNDPDGGVDARIRWPAGSPHDILPDGETALQYKSGKLTKRLLTDEFNKRGVQETLKRGGSYLLLVGHDYVPRQADKWRAELKKLCRKKRIKAGRCKVLFGSQIARWICRHPAVVIMPELRKDFPGFVTVSRWLLHPQLQNPWKPDAQRAELIERIRSFLRGELHVSVIRVQGQAGIGKTRMVLEAVKEQGIAERVVYTPNGDDQNVTDFLARAQAAPTVGAIAVVDECDRDRQETLKAYADLSEGRLKLICIGTADLLSPGAPELSNTWAMAPLSDEKVREVVNDAIGTAPKELVDTAVRLASGFVKLAIFVATHLKRQSNIPAVELARIDDVKHFLKSFVDDRTRRALQVFSVLSQVGWEEALVQEAEAIANFLAVPLPELRASVRALRDRGILIPRGRYLYVSPELLAISAAAELWDEWGPDLIKIVDSLPGPKPRRELLKRMAAMGEHARVRQAVESLLDEDGLFKTLADLDDEFRSEMLRILSSAVPGKAAEVLERIIAKGSKDELLGFERGRRNVMWTIETLVRWPETSLSAARSLRALALAENENIGNNATGIFCQFFHMYLSGSPLPLLERLTLVDELLESPDENSRILAVKALTAGLQHHESRMGGEVDHLSGRPYTPEWRPKTYGELWEARRAVLNRLRLVAGGDDTVAAEARKALVGSVFTLIRDGLWVDGINFLEELQPQDDEERRQILEAINRIERDVGERLSEEEKQRLKTLSGQVFDNSFSNRLRRWVGRRLHSDYDLVGKTGYQAADREAAKLAEEAVEAGISDSDLAWLASPEAQHVWAFGRRLGECDRDSALLDRIVSASTDDVNCVLLASYLNGQAGEKGEGFREDMLDRLASSRPLLAFASTWRGSASARGLDRILRLVNQGSVPPEMLGFLSYGGWTNSLSSEEVIRLLEALLKGEPNKVLDPTLRILLALIQREPESLEKLRPLIWKVLEMKPRRQWDLEWGQLAERMVREDPERMARIVLSFFQDEDFLPIQGDTTIQALATATQKEPGKCWELVGAALLDEGEAHRGFRLSLAIKGWYVELIPSDILISWARNHLPRGPSIVADLVIARAAPMPERARAVLISFPDDERVKSRIAGNLRSGLSVGPYSNRLKSDLEIAKGWAHDPHPRIRAFAVEVIKQLEAELLRHLIIEQEEEL